jgi:hypothetical protein
MEAVVLTAISLDARNRIIGGTIIANDDLEEPICLGAEALESHFQISPVVKRADENRNQWLLIE